MTRSQTRIVWAILFLGFLGSFYWFRFTFSADFMAVWLAGKFLAMGQPDQVYPALTEYFTMYPPTEWRPFMEAEYEYVGPVYPFIYPPLWAKVASLFADTNFWLLSFFAVFVNSAVQMLVVWLAVLAARPQNMHPGLFAFLGVFFLLGTHIGTISLQQNQPQIFVSLMLVLAIERGRAGADRASGAALAVAASLKLYPAMFAVYWLFTGNWRALGSFAVTGAALAALSVLWAGWPLHEVFIDQVRLISGSVLMTAISFNLDAAIAQYFFFDDLTWIAALEGPMGELAPGERPPGWYAMVRPPIWAFAATLWLLVVLGFTAWLYRRADHATRHAVIWPLGLTAVAIFSPLTWAYYFIPSVAFAPVIIDRLGAFRGGLLWLVTLILIFGPFVDYYRVTERWPDYEQFIYQWAGFTTFLLMAYAFWQASRAPAKRSTE